MTTTKNCGKIVSTKKTNPQKKGCCRNEYNIYSSKTQENL